MPTDGWSYTPGDTNKDKVRFLIGDTNALAPLLLDAEIDFTLTEQPDIYLAAAACCEAIALKQAPVSGSTLNGVMSVGNVSATYAQMAEALRLRSGLLAPSTPYAGGISESDKADNEQDTDRVGSSFTRDLGNFPGNRIGGQEPSTWGEEFD